MIVSADKMNPGMISYMSNIPPLIIYHKISETPPTIIPQTAPGKVILFQNKENKIIGPKAAPNPPHAQETNPNTELAGLSASPIAIAQMITTVARLIHTMLLCEYSFLNKVGNKSLETADAHTKSCELAVLMIAAKIAQSKIPAKADGNIS